MLIKVRITNKNQLELLIKKELIFLFNIFLKSFVILFLIIL